jgi:hypothetical protein
MARLLPVQLLSARLLEIDLEQWKIVESAFQINGDDAAVRSWNLVVLEHADGRVLVYLTDSLDKDSLVPVGMMLAREESVIAAVQRLIGKCPGAQTVLGDLILRLRGRGYH